MPWNSYARASRACALQQEKLHLLQLEKALLQQQRPSAANK